LVSFKSTPPLKGGFLYQSRVNLPMGSNVVDVWEARQGAIATRVPLPIDPIDAGMSEMSLAFYR
jgi:hypothetical protein